MATPRLRAFHAGALPASLAAQPAERSGAERISLDLKDADLVDVLRYFSHVSGLNLVLYPGVRGSVTLRLLDVPWDEALEVVLRTNGLGSVLDANVLELAPVDRAPRLEPGATRRARSTRCGDVPRRSR